ncbi:MAG: DUF262 domain-containing protein [Flavobacterium johnsoniae]|nr:MAG: DUF262 domain-containing protein [Flavobacterium johnsoniae]
MAEALTIEKIIARINSGDIRIPAFQRDFVWDADQVAFLLDSIYKEFPIGTVILWKTDKRLSTEKNLGYFELPEPRKDYPVNYVLDGQQRLTSLFSVFQTSLKPITNEWVDIFFDLSSKEKVQESSFLALEESEIDHTRHFPVKTFFDSVAYRKATKNLDDENLTKIDTVQRKFLSYIIPDIVFETDDMTNVAIVFERINRAGTELNVFELLSAWSWSDSFDLVEKFEQLQEEIADHGYEELCNDRDLQLRIIAGIIKQNTTPSSILSLSGDEIRENFEIVQKGIIGAIDYLKRELNIKHYKMLAFPGILVALSAFFATDKKDGTNYTSKQNIIIKKWFWRSLFSRRYSAGVNEHQSNDIGQMLQLLENEDHTFKLPQNELKIDFKKSNFSYANANSKTLISMLNQNNPISLLSGSRIDLDKVLKKGSKHEYHHIFPKKYLINLGKTRNEINSLANICFLTRSDNNNIKDRSPNIYSSRISKEKASEYLQSAFIPINFGSLSYEDFLDERINLLESFAKKLME